LIISNGQQSIVGTTQPKKLKPALTPTPLKKITLEKTVSGKIKLTKYSSFSVY